MRGFSLGHILYTLLSIHSSAYISCRTCFCNVGTKVPNPHIAICIHVNGPNTGPINLPSHRHDALIVSMCFYGQVAGPMSSIFFVIEL